MQNEKLPNFTVSDGIAFSPQLSSLGVMNFFTFDNIKWGNMSLVTNPRALSKFERLFKRKNIDSKEFIYIRPDHNDNIQHITKENLSAYRVFNAEKKSYSELLPIFIKTDGIITKEKVPIIIAPADCAIIVLTGIDKQDRKRFVILIHAGFTGVILNIHEKALKLARDLYNFQIKDLSAFIFPYIRDGHYKKCVKDIHWVSKLRSRGWEKFVRVEKGKMIIAFGEKMHYDLERYRIKNVTDSGIDTYQAEKKGKLFSHMYNKRDPRNAKKRFAVGVLL